ncbi:MAG: hypothetical protein QXD69_04660, partial [Candidatus Bathyarchaeia archaeon]
LNKTYLNSFDLIVVGGITYWWIHASKEDKEALISTEKPIIASANLGLNSTPTLNTLVGVYHKSKNDYEAWRAILPMNVTVITYTDVGLLSNKQLISKIQMIKDLSLTSFSRLYAYAEREGKRYPYIIFNGTKNYYINTFTYEGIKQVKIDVAIILDLMFDLFDDSYLMDIVFSKRSEKTIINTITMTVTKTFYKTDRSINASCIVFRTSKDVYKMSEEVIIVLKNNCNYALVLPNSAPWVVTDADGRVVYSPIALQVIREVSPGGELKWVWEQRDNGGGQVPLGTYYARIFTLNGGVFVVEFKIIEV